MHNRLVSVGGSHVLSTGDNKTLFVYGSNTSNQIGISGVSEKYIPEQMLKEDDCIFYVNSISTAYENSAVSDLEGKVWIFGETAAIQAPTKIPTQIYGKWDLVGIQSVHLSQDGLLCIDYNGEVWGIGSNEKGVLGLPKQEKYTKPKKIPLLRDIISIKCGQHHSIALDESGLVYSSGYGDFGQLGHGEFSSSFGFKNIKNIPIIQQISAGWNHTLLLSGDGDVFSFGCHFDGRLGYPSNDYVCIPTKVPDMPRISIVSSTFYSSLCVDSDDGTLWVFGETKTYLECDFLVPFKTSISGVVKISEGGFKVFLQDETGKIHILGDDIFLDYLKGIKETNFMFPVVKSYAKSARK